MRLIVEIEGQGTRAAIPRDGADLVALMSFALARGFGASHPLIDLADRLHRVHHISLGPLTTFYEADTEDAEDVAKYELAWQQPGPLRESLGAIAGALRDDPEAKRLADDAGAGELADECDALAAVAASAEAAAARIRLGYRL